MSNGHTELLFVLITMLVLFIFGVVVMAIFFWVWRKERK